MTELVCRPLEGEIIRPGATVRVVGRAHPLAGSRVELELEAGLSIAEILERAAGSSFAGGHVVYLGDHPIQPENYRKIRVKPGAVVTFFPRLQGGGGAVWKSVLALVIAVAAIVVAPYAAPFLAAAIGISAGVAQALVAGGIMLAGTLALNALFPVRPQQDQVTTGTLNSIQGAQNQANPFGPVPVVLGRHLQSPYYAAKPYTEIIGNDQYLRLLFCLGYGPLAIDSLQIGQTPIANFEGCSVEIRQGFASDTPVTLYPGEVDEQTLSLTLIDGNDQPGQNGVGGAWTSSVFTAVDTDQISVDFTAPDGIHMSDRNGGNDITWPVSVSMRYRLVGSGGGWGVQNATFTRSFYPTRRGIVVNVARGQYEVQAQRLTGNGDPNYAADTVVWTALRSLKQAAPLAFPKPLALVALRIKASDQLSGVISTFNCITTSLVKAFNGTAWVANTASQNPADLFRHVLQGPANARPVPDAQLDLATLQSWWAYCVANGFKFNQVITSAGSIYDKLCDITAAGRAVPTFSDGKWSVIWDRPSDPIVQHFTPRNSWGLQGQRAYAQQPHGWRVSFINEANGFTQDERIVYDDGYSATNATLFEGIEFPGVTDPALVWKHGRFHIAQARLRPEQVSISTGWEQLICQRGDRVRLTHDVMLIGLGAGRVKAVAGQVVTTDETVTIEAGKTYGLTFRVPDDARSVTVAVDPATAAGDYTQLTVIGDLSLVVPGVLYGFGETGQETADYRVQGISHQKDLVATLTLVDDAPAISTADQGAIPAYNPNVSIPADPFTLPPRNLVYTQVIEGQGANVSAVVRLAWQLPRTGNVVSFDVQARDDDAGGDWATVDSVPVPRMTTDVALTTAGIWSYRVRCVFSDGTVSTWTSLLELALAGLGVAPGDVTNLHIRAVDGQTVLDWTIVSDPRLLFYEVRKGTSWDTGLVVGDAVTQPPFPTTGDGTYHVRAYVLSPFGARVYSTDDASIDVSDSIISRNIILSSDEQGAGWPGSRDGAVIDGSFIRSDPAAVLSTPWGAEIVSQLALSGTHIAIYVSPQIVDIGRPQECRFWTLFEADGILQGDSFLDQTDVLGSQDLLGASPTRYIQAFPIWRFASSGAIDAFAPADIFSPSDIFGAGVTWGDWVAIASGTRVARFYQPGLVLITNRADTNATGTKFSWFVDVPDRTDDYTELSVPNTGLAVTFYYGGYDAAPGGAAVPLPFAGGPNGATVPHVQCAIVNPTNGDEVKISNLTAAGCTVNVVNAGANVARSGVNLLVRGY